MLHGNSSKRPQPLVAFERRQNRCRSEAAANRGQLT
jgi:hypothetical protein